MLVIVSVIVAGCIQQPSIKDNLSKESPTCLPNMQSENRFYSVIQGEPFTYKGEIPNRNIQFVSVEARSPFSEIPVVSESVPVNPDGTFIFTLNGSITQGWGTVSLIGEKYAPILVSLNLTTTEEHFNLNIIQTPTNVLCNQNKNWIHINPFKTIQVSGEFRNVTRDLDINGTTNLPPGEEITLMILSTSTNPCQNRLYPDNLISHCVYPVEKKIKVQNSSCGANSWSFDINTSYYRFADSEYAVFVSAVNKSQENCSSWDAMMFTLEFDKPKTQGFPTLTPIKSIFTQTTPL
jgi:hypothetical protein